MEFVDASERKKRAPDEELPFHWTLGEDAIAALKPKVQALEIDLEKSLAWSRELTFDGLPN